MSRDEKLVALELDADSTLPHVGAGGKLDYSMATEPKPGVYADTAEDEYVSIRDSLRVLRERLWLIMLVAIILAGATVGFSLLRTPQYEASVKVLVGQKQSTSDPSNLQGNVQGLQQLTQTLAEAANSRPLAEAVIRQLNLGTTPEDFLKNVSVRRVPDTQFIEMSYTDPDPKRARDGANAIGDVFSSQISEISPDASAVTATVWEPAAVPDNPITPNPIRDGALALLLGTFVGVGLAFLLEYLDDSWRSPEEAEQVSGVPTFGTIPQFVATKGAKTEGKGPEVDGLSPRLVTISEPSGIATEAFRTLRTSLLYVDADTPPKVVVLTSSGPREGKSTICANLGVVLAQAGKRTLIIDCDLRRPAIHEIFGLHNSNGLTNVLAEEYSLPEVWQEPLTRLKVVTAGAPLPSDPTELLGSEGFAELINRARQTFDYTLVDAPPIEPVSDPAILATRADGVLLVLDAKESRKRSVQQSIHNLDTVGANVLGTVMNNVEASKRGYYGGGYAYGYGSTFEEKPG